MKNRNSIFVLIIIICIVAICIGIYAQVFAEETGVNKFMVGTGQTLTPQITPEEQKLKDDFNDIFQNIIIYRTSNLNSLSQRKDLYKDLVYTSIHGSKQEIDIYNIDVNIPALNIESDIAHQINAEIEQVFLTKVTNIVNSNTQDYTIYNANYIAYGYEDILSLVIRATLKEGDKAQRIIFITYNYDLNTKKIITLEELLNYKQINTKTLQNKINIEIKEISKKINDLQQLGLDIYKRDPNNSMYNIKNTKHYFLGEDGYLYILYPYGNNDYTSEVDIILV